MKKTVIVAQQLLKFCKFDEELTFHILKDLVKIWCEDTYDIIMSGLATGEYEINDYEDFLDVMSLIMTTEEWSNFEEELYAYIEDTAE